MGQDEADQDETDQHKPYTPHRSPVCGHGGMCAFAGTWSASCSLASSSAVFLTQLSFGSAAHVSRVSATPGAALSECPSAATGAERSGAAHGSGGSAAGVSFLHLSGTALSGFGLPLGRLSTGQYRTARLPGQQPAGSAFHGVPAGQVSGLAFRLVSGYSHSWPPG